MIPVQDRLKSATARSIYYHFFILQYLFGPTKLVFVINDFIFDIDYVLDKTNEVENFAF